MLTCEQPHSGVLPKAGVHSPEWLKRETVQIMGEYHYTKTPAGQLDQLVILLYDSSYESNASLAFDSVPRGYF